MNRTKLDLEQEVFGGLKELDEQLTVDIQDNMFEFEDFIKLTAAVCRP